MRFASTTLELTLIDKNTAASARYVRALAAMSSLVVVLSAFGADASKMETASAETELSFEPITVIGKLRIPDSLFGHSGKLLMRTVPVRKSGMETGVLQSLFGDSAFVRPAVRTVDLPDDKRRFSLATLVPFTSKVAGKIGSYRIGDWPTELGKSLGDAYAAPAGFIQVTRENQDTHVSENFRLRDFLTKDQANVWPKYLVLRTELIDKLELIMTDLRSHGYQVKSLRVMSGFRTPQYNTQGVGSGGRATLSRHQYGDAADVYVDNSGKGWMSDLNRDGRVDTRDAQVILDAAARVEKKYPDLTGGSGLYDATSAHGPFAHIDVRGQRASWTG
jgi:uncharacterized protein YcbK (DUF882 family)